MQWFKRHPDFLRDESCALSNDSNYKEIYQCRNNLFLSHGNVIVRLDKVYRHPILIVYTDATPYQLPLIFPLNAEIGTYELDLLASMNFDDLKGHIGSLIKYYYEFRHQNQGGDLCVVEWDNLDDGSKFYGITTIISRLRDWYAGHITGKFPPDSQEVEYTAHFKAVNMGINFLYPEAFLNEKLVAGRFYATEIRRLNNESSFIYHGSFIDGISTSGLIENSGHYLLTKLLDKKLVSSVDFQTNKELVKNYIKSKELITGLWFDVKSVLVPFEHLNDLIIIIGEGDLEDGIRRMANVGSDFFETTPDYFIIGIRYPNKRAKLEFQLFKILVKKENLPALDLSSGPLERMRSILNRYEPVEAIQGEKFSEENFHTRNSKRANYEVLKTGTVNLFGVGAIGGEISDSLSKAGIGSIVLVDNQTIKAHNPVRHLAGLSYVGVPKTLAVKEIISDHNPFIQVYELAYNLYSTIDLMYRRGNFVTVSSVADDNLEGYINEHAVIAGMTMFYVRAMRGGKAARIFRVIPGKDACFHCISLYRQENSKPIVIEEDKSFPIIKNECNNPVRPASAADLKLISALASRIIIDHLQEGESKDNHWIWSSEILESVQIKTPFSLVSHNIKPHPQCYYCNHDKELKVTINSETLQAMRDLVKEKGKLETGGVLAGIADAEGNILITHASGPGPSAVHKQTEFRKDVPFCQGFLDTLYIESANKTLYVGEWHSHPDANNTPSGLDIKSLSEIALQKEYLTVNPTMIIFSNDGNPSCTIHPAGRRHYVVELEVKMSDEIA